MDVPSRLISVGRLDQESEGLLLLTNSGSLSRTLELPANGFVRKYLVKTTGVNVRVNVCVCVCVCARITWTWHVIMYVCVSDVFINVYIHR
jgi:hypothetical protein